MNARPVAELLAIASSGAFAADLPVKAPPPVSTPTYNWTGFYMGANFGGAWASDALTDNLSGTTLTGDSSRVIGGGQIGFNWQISPQFVLGVEGTFDGTSIGNSGNTATIFNDHTLKGDVHTNWLSTLAGRFGFATNNLLFYGKGGGGWVKNGVTMTDLHTGSSISNFFTNSGWLVGAGVEYGVTANWTMKLEYDYLRLSSWTGYAAPIFYGDTITLTREINMFAVGLNYKF